MESSISSSRPPRGVIPKRIWQEYRALELSRAIHEYIAIGNFNTCDKWVEELIELLKQLSPGTSKDDNSHIS